jgi:uncharacterized protein (DUF2141 family)
MKAHRLLLLTVTMMACGADAGAIPAEAGAASGTLVVTIHGFRNGAGHARVAVFNRDAGFPDDESAAYRKDVADIHDGRVEVRFDDLPFAEYAVSMYHDENGDVKLNKGLFGIPKEGYGVSNNIVHAVRAPKFDEARFRLDTASHTVTINVHYSAGKTHDETDRARDRRVERHRARVGSTARRGRT